MQVLHILPESVLYGRHLLRQGDYITSVNGKPLEHDSDCEPLLESSSTVVCIELLRNINVKTFDDSCTGQKPTFETLQNNVFVVNQTDRQSLGNELNQNDLFTRSKLRLSYRSAFDHGSLRYEQDQEQNHQMSCERQLLDSATSFSRRRDVARRHVRKVGEQFPESGVIDLSSRVLDRNSSSTAIESSEVVRVTKNVPASPVHQSVDRRTVKHSKAVRFKLSEKDKIAKDKKKEKDVRKEHISCTDRSLLSEKQLELTATTISCVKWLPDLTEHIRCPRIVSHRLGTTLCFILTTNHHQVSCKLHQKNCDVKLGSSMDMLQNRQFLMSSKAITSTGLSPNKNPSSVQEEFDQKFWDSSNVPIYSSIISFGSGGNVVLTSRITPSTYQPFVLRRGRVSRVFQIIVIQDENGLGIEAAVEPSGAVITSIADDGPVDKNGNVRYWYGFLSQI